MVPAAAGSGEPALRSGDSCCAQVPILRRAGCPHPAANSASASVQRRRGAHRAPAPRAAARGSMRFAAKSKVPAAGRRGRRPLQKCVLPTSTCRGRPPDVPLPAAADISVRAAGTPHFLPLHYYLFLQPSASAGGCTRKGYAASVRRQSRQRLRYGHPPLRRRTATVRDTAKTYLHPQKRGLVLRFLHGLPISAHTSAG